MRKKLLLVAAAAIAVATAGALFAGCSAESHHEEGDEHNHICEFTQKYESTEYLCSDATCTTPATYYYRCSICGQAGTETFEAGEPLGHWLPEEFTVDKEADCTHEGHMYKRCGRCEETIEEETITALGHDFGEAWNYTADSHWHKCSRCEEISGSGAHVFEVDDTFGVYACTGCDYVEVENNKQIWNAETGLEYALNDDGKSYAVTGFKVEAEKFYVPLTYEGLPVTKIAERAFMNNANIKSVVLQNNITEVGDYAFYGCDNLLAVRLPSSLAKVGSFAFFTEAHDRCVYITDLTEYCNLNGADYLCAERLFINNEEVTQLSIPEGVTKIYGRQFENLKNVTDLILPSTLTVIGNDYFRNSEGAFSGMPELKSITVAKDNPVYYSENNCLLLNVFYGSSVNRGVELLVGCSTSVIPDGVTKICDGAFSGSLIGEISVPASVTEIGAGAFRGCTMLNKVTLSEGLKKIETSAFSGCLSLDVIKIPESVEKIGSDAFKDAPVIKQAASGSILYVDNWAVGYSGVVGTSASLREGTVGIADYAFSGRSFSHFTFNDGLKHVGESAFYRCSSLTSVTLPDSVETVGDNAFDRCTSLSFFRFGKGIKSVGGFVFDENWKQTMAANIKTVGGVTYVGNVAMECEKNVTDVQLEEGTRVIAYSAFSECTNLQSITINKELAGVGGYAFLRCGNLTAVNYAGTQAEWEQVVKGAGWCEQVGFVQIHCADGDAPARK